MAGAAVLSISPSTLKLSVSSSPSLPRSYDSLALPFLQRKIPRLTICHAKFDGSIGEATERMYRMNFESVEEEEEEDDSDEEEETESSIDLLIRFVQSMFDKVSKRARKATRSILPPGVFSPQLPMNCILQPSRTRGWNNSHYHWQASHREHGGNRLPKPTRARSLLRLMEF